MVVRGCSAFPALESFAAGHVAPPWSELTTAPYPILGYQSRCPWTLFVDKAIYTAEHRRLSALLRGLREEAGLRQVDVAEALDMPQSFVSKYETGERRLDLVELQQVCFALQTTLADLVGRFEQPRIR